MGPLFGAPKPKDLHPFREIAVRALRPLRGTIADVLETLIEISRLTGMRKAFALILARQHQRQPPAGRLGRRFYELKTTVRLQRDVEVRADPRRPARRPTHYG